MLRTVSCFALFTALIVFIPDARAQNPNNPLDVTGDGFVNVLDQVAEVNDLNVNGSHATPSSFYDVNGDGYVTPLDSLRIENYKLLATGPQAPPVGYGPFNTTVPAHAAHISLVVADLQGVPISTVAAGQEFLVEAFVQDTRPSPQGVYAAYTDLAYSAAQVSVVSGSFTLGDFYPANTPGTGAPGLLTSAGGFRAPPTFGPPGGAAQHLFSVLMVAQTPGTTSFSSVPSSSAPITDTLLYGLDVAVPTGQIDYSGASLTIVPEPPAVALFGCGALVLCIVLATRRSRRMHCV